MNRLTLLTITLYILAASIIRAQDFSKADVYLLTCGPGTETYSIYGHSALRIVVPDQKRDIVYNWGVFDFNTPNFVWKFAKGRLDYMLGVYPYEEFVKEYQAEHRWILSQKVNLSDKEKNDLFVLINENLKPDNLRYRYDFFYDNCSTRIRDLLEKSVGNDLLYPEAEPRRNMKTFRELSGQYQQRFQWLKFGIDLLLGSPSDKKADFRAEMFLPLYLQSGLSRLDIRRTGKMIPLLGNPETLIAFKNPVVKEKFLLSPIFIFSMVLIAVIILTGAVRKKGTNWIIDIIIYTLFSLLALMMVFFNFFTDHPQLRWNFNILWLNPVIPVCLGCLIAGRDCMNWFRIAFFLIALFLLTMIILPQHFDNAVVPLSAILLIRTSIRAGFTWNPLTLPDLT